MPASLEHSYLSLWDTSVYSTFHI